MAQLPQEVNRVRTYMAADDAAFKEIVAARALTVLLRLVKRGAVAKSGISRNAKWALPFDTKID